MPTCKKHSKFEITNGIYFRAANPDKPCDWVPKSESARSAYYNIATTGSLEAMGELLGEAQMIHSNESSRDSGYVSVARCPACLFSSTDDSVKSLLSHSPLMLQFKINPKNERRAPFVFDIGGETLGATETESLVLLPPGQSLMDYHVGYITRGYLASLA